MKTKFKILHLEDTLSNINLVEKELRKGNIQIDKMVVDNKDAFENALKEFTPDIIISGDKLDSFDSTEAIEIIKQKALKIPFIFVASTNTEEYAVEFLKAGADDYILKNSLHHLPQVVLNAIEKSRIEKEEMQLIYDPANLTTILNASNDSIIGHRMDGIITSWNLGATNLFGYTEEEILGKNISSIIPSDLLTEESEFMAIIKRGESVKHFQTERFTKSKTLVNVSLTIAPLKDSDGKIIGAIKIAYNITDRKNAEKIIIESKEKYHSLFKNSMDGILLTETDGKILAANPAACTMFKMSEEEICNAGRFGLVDNTDPRVAAAVEERQRTGKATAELTLIRGNGERFPGELNSVIYKDANGEQRTSMIVRDISEKQHAEQLLKNREQFTREILASLPSHIVVIDQTGNIITTNKAWDDFANSNGADTVKEVSIGCNYFEVCKKSMAAGDLLAGQVLQGIQSVFNQEAEIFELEYPCHSLVEQRWFNLSVTKFSEDDSKIVISHHNITKRKIAEIRLEETKEALQKTLSEHHKILDFSLDVICTINADGEFVNVSAASEQVWGYTPEELIGTKYIKLVNDKDVAKTSIAAKKIHISKQIPLFENSYVHKNGKIVPLLWSINWDENLQLMFCIAKDVTEKKGLEKAMKNERDQFYDMFSKAPSAIGMLKGDNHVFEMVNPNYLQMIGKVDIIGKTVAEVLPEVIVQGFIGILDHVYQTGTTYSGTEKLVKIDKYENGEMTNIYINFVYQAYRNGEGKIEGVFFFMNDITEHIQSRKNIEKSEKQYRQIVETAQEGIWLIDENSRTTFVNKKICELLEYHEDELIGKKNSFFMNADSKEKAPAALERRKRGIAENMEIGFISKHGKHILTKVSATPILDDLGCFKGSLGMVSDITEKKHLVKLLEKSNRLAAVGSWEIDVVKGTVYWSDITKEIREVDKDFVPTLDVGISYFEDGHKDIISQKIRECIENGTPWDEELKIITFKGNDKWVRTKGEGEFLNGICIKIHGSFQDIDKLKNAEIKIKESEFQYRQIVETAQEGIWMLDENNETTFVNQKMCEIIGYSFKEMIGKTYFFFKDETDLRIAINNLERRKQGISETYKASFMTKNGRQIWTQISSNPIFDDTGAYGGSLLMVSDITERLMADKLLMESEQKYRKIASELDIERTRLVKAQTVAKVGSWETDLKTFQVKWSAETYRIFGSTPENFEASHTAFMNFIHPEDREKVDAAFKSSLNKRGSNTLEHRIVTTQGIEKWVEENWSVTNDEKGTPIIAAGTCQDITESKIAADKVIRNEAKLKVAQHIARVGSYEIDMVTKEHSWSDEFYSILGINETVKPSSEVFVSYIHPDDRAMAVNTIKEALSLYTNSSFQFRFIKSNGETGYALSEWKVEFDSHQNPIYIHGILRDLTKEKQAESERLKMISDIVQRNGDLEQFSYIVSHNLRAPIANIIGFAEILQEETINPKEQKELLQGLSASVVGLDTVIKDINTILQSKRDDHEKKEIIIFSKLVNDIMLSIGNLLAKHRVRIITDFSDVDEIYSLKVYIYSIFHNLISNSIKYGRPEEPPRIEIKSKKENGILFLTFKDNGLGIDMDKKGNKIFGLYNRFHSHVEGKGMGLFMVKSQVEALGGKITFTSEPNKGTEFTVELEI
ncbi:PAS domain S-box protein [Gelidibacter salicanalis]|uniref:histidine kinase n=1 Tax=Gelidibacter salicanalis TaxID=291193 RepID=A0A5C7AMZ0_9FLAO|nr:PAS domain S-box protein [Gelidibacter salicanalis]TXE07935.1 PAS domain S-box protein [Gelidibacter salicanalis]